MNKDLKKKYFDLFSKFEEEFDEKAMTNSILIGLYYMLIKKNVCSEEELLSLISGETFEIK